MAQLKMEFLGDFGLRWTGQRSRDLSPTKYAPCWHIWRPKPASPAPGEPGGAAVAGLAG